MKIQKYIDMAYGNPRGREWLNITHEEYLWSKWCQEVLNHTQSYWVPDLERPEKILIAAIWHFGFAHNSPMSLELRRTARRLRRSDPPERGVGAPKREFAVGAQDIGVYKMPLEFYLLDNFLEHEVRPRMDSSTKVS